MQNCRESWLILYLILGLLLDGPPYLTQNSSQHSDFWFRRHGPTKEAAELLHPAFDGVRVEVADVEEQGGQLVEEGFEAIEGGRWGCGVWGCGVWGVGCGGVGELAEFVAADGDGLGEVEGGVEGVAGDGNEAVGVGEFWVFEAAIFSAKDEGAVVVGAVGGGE